MRHLVTFILLAAACAPTWAADLHLPGYEAQMARYDIAGVRLGMSPEQVMAEAAKRDFVVREPKTEIQRSCDGRCVVARAIAARRGTSLGTSLGITSEGTSFIHFWGPRKQLLEVLFAPSIAGQVVKEVRYAMGSDQITRETFDQQAVEKYGPRAPRMALFCFPQEQYCNERVFADSFYLPHIVNPARMSISPAGWGGMYYMTLEEGTLLRDKRAREFAAAIEKAVPRDAKASF